DEDALAFANLYPKKYDAIARVAPHCPPSRERPPAEIKEQASGALNETGIGAEVMGRADHDGAGGQEMSVRGLDFAEIFDLVGIRILVDDVNNCYAAIGVVHSLFQALPGRFKDYISAPRFGVYQSLHTTVIAGESTLEVQVRTHEMH